MLLVLLVGYVALPAVAGAQSSNAAAKSSLAVPVTGTTDATAPATSGALSSIGAGTFNGTFNIQHFTAANGALSAVGTLVGTVTSTAGVTTVVLNNVVIPLATPTAPTCPVLSLTLGPLHLDLLGLVIDLNQVNLNITAVPGAGNLLGNLLCDVANLLNNPSGLANLLNSILGALRL